MIRRLPQVFLELTVWQVYPSFAMQNYIRVYLWLIQVIGLLVVRQRPRYYPGTDLARTGLFQSTR